TAAFGEAPSAFVHEERAYLAVMLAGPRLHELAAVPPPPSRFFAYGQPQAPSPARVLARDESIVPATDDWPFLYMRAPALPRHYLSALAVILIISAAAVFATVKGSYRFFSWHFFFLGAGFMLLAPPLQRELQALAVGSGRLRREPARRDDRRSLRVRVAARRV